MEQNRPRIGYGVTHTLEETAEHFGITRQRVQQIKQSAFRKLRAALKRRYGVTGTVDLI